MCGRFAQFYGEQELVDLGAISYIMSETKQRFNIAPTQNAQVVRKCDNQTQLINLKWGLIPSWAKINSELKPQINARIETASEKPMFKSSFKSKRCIIPSSGFYEWKDKTPYFIKHKENVPIFFAGLWDRSAYGETFTILTCEANKFMQEIHHRMPCLLKIEDFSNWLNNSNDNFEFSIGEKNLIKYKVSSFVNYTKNDSPLCINEIN